MDLTGPWPASSKGSLLWLQPEPAQGSARLWDGQGEGKGRVEVPRTDRAQLSLGPAEACSEKKVDGKAFPVLPKDYLGTFSGGLARNQGETNSIYLFKTWKC